MTKETTEQQNSLNSAEVLKKIDKEKSPKLYKATETLIKAQELADNYKIRAEKAEKEAKKVSEEPRETETPIKPPEEKGTPTTPYSLQDIRALNNVHDEDVERVEKFAKGENVSIAEALKNDDLKAILRNRDELRKTADATNTGGGKRATSKTTGKELLRKLEKGEFPESDEDIDKLAEASLKEKMKK